MPSSKMKSKIMYCTNRSRGCPFFVLEKPDLTGQLGWPRDLSTVEVIVPPNASEQTKRIALARETEKRKIQMMVHER